MAIKIEDDVPVPTNPWQGRGKSEERVLLEKMEIGQSFFTPRKISNVLTMSRKVAAITGAKFTGRTVSTPAGKGTRVWRIA